MKNKLILCLLLNLMLLLSGCFMPVSPDDPNYIYLDNGIGVYLNYDKPIVVINDGTLGIQLFEDHRTLGYWYVGHEDIYSLEFTPDNLVFVNGESFGEWLWASTNIMIINSSDGFMYLLRFEFIENEVSYLTLTDVATEQQYVFMGVKVDAQ